MSNVIKIVHVDTNKFALNEMQKDIPQIVPNAELHCFNDPEQALAFAKDQGCDVLLTEVELWQEQFGGIRLAKAIQELNPQVKIIFVTVWIEYEVSKELSKLRVNGFIPKPWKLEKLAEVLNSLLYPAQPHNTT